MILELVGRVRNAAYEIINAKGYTNWAIGLVISTLAGIIIDDRRSIEPVSSLLDGEYGLYDVCLSVPTLIGRDGVSRLIRLNLEERELEALHKSAKVLKDVIARAEI